MRAMGSRQVRSVATKHKPDVVPGTDGRVQAAGSPVWLADPRGDGCWITAFLAGKSMGRPRVCTPSVGADTSRVERANTP